MKYYFLTLLVALLVPNEVTVSRLNNTLINRSGNLVGGATSLHTEVGAIKKPSSLAVGDYLLIRFDAKTMVCKSEVPIGPTGDPALKLGTSADASNGYDYSSNPLNEWVRVGVDPIAEITALLDAAGFDKSKYGGTVRGSFDSWVGSAQDLESGIAYIPWGGGHHGSSLNGIWALNLTTMEWYIESMPSDPFAPGYEWSHEYWDAPSWTTYRPEEDTAVPDMLPDGKPTGRHTYGTPWYDSKRNTINASFWSLWTYELATKETNYKQWIDTSDGKIYHVQSNAEMLYDAVTDRVFGSMPRIEQSGGRFFISSNINGEHYRLPSPVRHAPSCYTMNGRTLYALGGDKGQEWGHLNMDTEVWESGDITDLPAQESGQASQVCIFVPQWGKILRQFTANTGLNRGDWYLYDPTTHLHERYTPKGDVPLGRRPFTKAFYYPRGKSLIYIKIGGAETPDINDVYVMRVGELDSTEPPSTEPTPVEPQPTEPPPIEPPIVECGLKLGLPECPENDVTYKPDLPEPGSYSVAGACAPIHNDNAASVSLRDGELLADAYGRLMAIANPLVGGVVEIPFDVATVQCDRIGVTKFMAGGVTFRGILGPNGERPRMYCRNTKKDGTVPPKAANTSAFSFGIGGYPAMVENMHIDGYGQAIGIGAKHFVARNNYIHHQFENSINGYVFKEHKAGHNVNIEICGNEVAHGGHGNIRHNFYMHRHQGEDYEVHVTLVDNLIHSGWGSAGYKSAAERNTILNNKFHTSLFTDPSYSEHKTSMLIDIAGCAVNTINGNELNAWKPTTKGGHHVVGIRNRKDTIRGCDIPKGWSADKPPTKLASEFWNPEYWAGLDGQYIFPTTIENNTFIGTGKYISQWPAMTNFGTYPNYSVKSFGSSCILEAPADWYERSRIFSDHNIYTGFSSFYHNAPITHDSKRCGYPDPLYPDDGPGPSDDMIKAGPNEVYQ